MTPVEAAASAEVQVAAAAEAEVVAAAQGATEEADADGAAASVDSSSCC